MKVSILIGTAAILSCKPASVGQNEVKDSDDRVEPGLEEVSAHGVLPPRERGEALAVADNLNVSGPNNGLGGRGEIAIALVGENTREKCRDRLDDIHCYADACMAELGGNPADNAMPAGIDPRDPRIGEEVKIYWNGRQIKWERYNGTWQYTFGGRPGGSNWPEDGAGLQAPVTNSRLLKCDWGGAGNWTSCIPGQKRMVIERNGVTWVYLFRRNAPVQPGVATTNARHPNSWRNIAVLGYKKTENKLRAGSDSTAANAVCWFNTFNKTNRGVRKFFPLPVPGGRFGNSQAEQRRRQIAIDFWDTPREHRTLTARMRGASNAEGDNCVTCHGNGPILGVQWFWEHDSKDPTDDDLPFFSAADLHNPRTFWQAPAEACGECHTYWATNSRTCSSMVREYTSVGNSANLSRKRTTANQRNVDATHMMPPDYGLSAEEWENEYRRSVEEILQCCNGNCRHPTFQVRAPQYIGAHERPPRDSYHQRIAPPTEAVGLTVHRKDCRDNTCQFTATWSDPDNAYNAPEHYRIEIGKLGQSSAYCRDADERDGKNAREQVIQTWQNRYEWDLSVYCDEPKELRVCGEYNTHRTPSRSLGVVSALQCP